MLILSVLLGILIGLVTGGRFRNLERLGLRFSVLVLAAFGLKLVVYRFTLSPDGPELLFRFGPPIQALVVYPALLLFIWFNREIRDLRTVGLGVFLNALPIWLNGGRMPVCAESMRRAGMGFFIERLGAGSPATHALASESTLLGFLGDVLVVPVPYLGAQVVSPGDLLIFLGMIALIYSSMHGRGSGDAAGESDLRGPKG